MRDRSANPSRATKPAPGKLRKIAFGWYGGKYGHLEWLLPLLPSAHHYCEPFGGSAAVLINREPSSVETYNDIDGDIARFFRVLRTQTDELLKQIALTPFSREEFELSLLRDGQNTSDLELARRFFVRARQVRTGFAQTATQGRWAYCRLDSRSGMAAAVSRWLGSIEGLSEITQRLLRVQIENAPAIDVLERYDSGSTLFYCDPPYPHESRVDPRTYSYEMTDDQHEELARVLHGLKANVAISGYQCRLMKNLYSDWHRTEGPTRMSHSGKSARQEVLWTNYLPASK